MKKKRVAIAMSGGVDSSAAAALLVREGYDVIGLHLKLYDAPVEERKNKSCCSLDDSMDARAVCRQLKIPFYVLDFQEEFQESVIDYFIAEYAIGKTPNPCVMCNKKIKSRYLLEKVKELDCDYLATGHYAKIQQQTESQKYQLLRSTDRKKDQTYFLFGVPSEDLSKLLFPLANYEKSQVREIAHEYGFESANKPDSQEICFVPKNYRDFLNHHLPTAPAMGEFVNVQGDVLGQHQGIPYYTVGQRRGLGMSSPEPLYVVRIDKEKNQVVLGTEQESYSHSVFVSEVNWVSILPITEPITATVRLRYSHRGTPATLIPKERDAVEVQLHTPQRAVALGQAAVFYDGDVVLGGGWIVQN